MMKAAIYRKFGGPEVVNIEEIPKPSPRNTDILVKVLATTVSIADHRVRCLDLPKGFWIFGPLALGVFAPRKKILGMDIAGIVQAVGKSVTKFKPGDEVIALTGANFGGHAEYVCLPENDPISLKPKNMNFEEAVTLVFGGVTALSFFNRFPIKSGDEVLVNGASGAVGTAVIQIANHFGAIVTGICSGGNAKFVSLLGAHHVIDYKREDFTKNGETYDVIVECVGNASFERVRDSIKPGGVLLLMITDLKGTLSAWLNSKKSGKRITASQDKPLAKDLVSYPPKLGR
ncbi:MAG: NAD(P)-dependent alcohol dehydrogenase [Emcibacter sp.]|nr:NAD(P)-dependent alcohol dehydrogenase [Emcibacter sp.]